ncbi:hypothetical protein KP509_28G064200 [Ceratopteris richardii]|uniref:J domain-containing protein n=1 Tax=Ceratopteris richardii TaxID=49495 RepID=A0A8T2REX0_CERRI|nr:hypothetical protein KP509_28G064200 [Ceratopteris richardii]
MNDVHLIACIFDHGRKEFWTVLVLWSMDCNKDEASRSKDIAEKRFMQGDYIGARKFARKAWQLFPGLEGLGHFIPVVEVHATAHEKSQCGEKDWYGILQCDPSADETCLRKQYRKLALTLHPDKNKATGAEAAFQYISEAWNILSDKAKKAEYDIKRAPPAASPAPNRKSAPVRQNKGTEKPPQQRKKSKSSSTEACNAQTFVHHESSLPKTFWTACPDCKLQYEYSTAYKNKRLCCPFCLKPFIAKELALVLSGQIIWPPTGERGADTFTARR